MTAKKKTKAGERPLTIYFVRHAQAMEVLEGVQGPDDPPLSQLGQRQAVRLARRLQMEKFDHAYTSPLTRARQTAEAVLEFHKGLNVTMSKDIVEIGRDHFVEVPQGFSPSHPQVLVREQDALVRFANRIRHTHEPGQRLLVVAHGNLIRSLMPMLGGRNPLESLLLEISNASLCILDVWASGSAILRLGNCVKHLLPGEITS